MGLKSHSKLCKVRWGAGEPCQDFETWREFEVFFKTMQTDPGRGPGLTPTPCHQAGVPRPDSAGERLGFVEDLLEALAHRL